MNIQYRQLLLFLLKHFEHPVSYNKTSNHAPVVKAGPATAAAPQKFSTKCKFTEGDRAGQTVDFAPHAPLPVGGDCNDGTASSGVVVE